MIQAYNMVLLTSSENPGEFIVGPSGNKNEQSTQTTASTQTQNNGNANSGSPFGSMGILLLYVVVIGAAFYFTSRSQKKKEKAVRDLQEAITIGDEVHTSGGLFGKVVEKIDDKYIIEFGTNKGVRIPVRKSDVYPLKKDAQVSEKPSK